MGMNVAVSWVMPSRMVRMAKSLPKLIVRVIILVVGITKIIKRDIIFIIGPSLFSILSLHLLLYFVSVSAGNMDTNLNAL